ncbi:hypothetical protein GCM10009767_17450 [Kocuria aegyptia]|uniref:Uncharacterized protein n=1 Tax=Kocuria aegyptia TaxID=330943 RepID=A0ABN2KLY6_9MICC
MRPTIGPAVPLRVQAHGGGHRLSGAGADVPTPRGPDGVAAPLDVPADRPAFTGTLSLMPEVRLRTGGARAVTDRSESDPAYGTDRAGPVGCRVVGTSSVSSVGEFMAARGSVPDDIDLIGRGGNITSSAHGGAENPGLTAADIVAGVAPGQVEGCGAVDIVDGHPGEGLGFWADTRDDLGPHLIAPPPLPESTAALVADRHEQLTDRRATHHILVQDRTHLWPACWSVTADGPPDDHHDDDGHDCSDDEYTEKDHLHHHHATAAGKPARGQASAEQQHGSGQHCTGGRRSHHLPLSRPGALSLPERAGKDLPRRCHRRPIPPLGHRSRCRHPSDCFDLSAPFLGTTPKPAHRVESDNRWHARRRLRRIDEP